MRFTKQRNMRFRLLAALAAALGAGGCDLDLTNPNSPPAEVVLNTPDGIIALATGMQGQYAGTGVGTGVVLNAVRTPALVTDEWGGTSRILAADRALITGQGVDASFLVATQPFSSSFRVIRSAEELIESAPGVGLGKGTLAGVLATAKTFKAMSLGVLYSQYQRAPTSATLGSNPLRPRGEVLDSAIALLESARTDLASATTVELADFRARVQGPGYNLAEVINAYLARYYLWDGQYQNAIDAANRVPLNRLNVLTYPDPNRNPVWGYATSLLYVGGRNTFVTEAQAGDQRPAFWLRTDLPPTTTGATPGPIRTLRQFQDRNESYPLFLPDEMRLIKAEAFARLGNFAQARTFLNEVRTQQSSTFNEPTAGLPAVSVDAIDTLDEALRLIAYERRYELYEQGLRWEDVRRLGPAVAGGQMSIAFLPTPQGECLYNPGSGC